MEELPDQYHEPLSTEFPPTEDQLSANTHVAPTNKEGQLDRETMLRTRTPKEQLTAEQIARLDELRGRVITSAEIKGINKARAAGNHIGYF